MITQKLLAVSLLGTEWILYLLIAFSVISLAIIVEKFFFLWGKKGNGEAMEEKIQSLLLHGDAEKFLKAFNGNTTSPALIITGLLRYSLNKGSDPQEYLSILLSQQKIQLESRLVFLGTLVSIAPFIGLLGTVLGIINAFHGLSLNKQGSNFVMAGISEALVATALGLFVAIPAAIAYNYFLRTIKKILVSSENLARSIMLALPAGKK